MYKRGIFDAWVATYNVNEHHQNGYWWESDTTVSIDDDELGCSASSTFRPCIALAASRARTRQR